MRTGARLCCLFGIGWASVASALTPAEQRAYREKFLETTPRVEAFSQWVEKTNALPPDFDALPKQNELPDPFKFLDGRPVNMPADWNARRAEIRQLFEKYMIGTLPPKPNLDQVVVLDAAAIAAEAAARGGGAGGRGFGPRGAGPATGASPATNAAPGNAPIEAPRGRAGGGIRGGRGGAGPAPGSITRVVDLKYGPQSQITTRVTVVIPPGTGPFPVLIGGNPSVTSRGYISCQFPSSVDMGGFGRGATAGGDPLQTPLNLKRFYPDITAGSMGEVAWSAQMVVDYLYTLPEVNKAQIAITGYSRGGKLMMLAAALDERITAVIAGSTGVGGVLPWRYASENNVAESIESTTRMFPIWYAPQFRFFAGREDRLPVDANLMAALIAPRAILNLYGLNDEVSNTWGNEKSYYEMAKMYTAFGHPERLGILHPPGHHGANDEASSMKWLDIQFGRSTETWKNEYLFPWDWNQWKDKTGTKLDVNSFAPHAPGDLLTGVSSSADWEKKAEQVRSAVKLMLGDAPPAASRANAKVSNPGDEGIDDTPRWVIGRSIIEHGWTRQQAAGIATKDIKFGVGDIRGDFYFKEGVSPGTKLPAVIFLHGNSYPLGYMWVYRTDPHPIIALANAGYAVLAYDQSGFGSRMNEAATFYDKNPQWSQMGRMVEDARAAVEAAMKDPMVDPQRVYVFGYGLGGSVALHAAALEPNIKGVVSVCGFTPMRTDTPDKKTGGVARYSHERGIIPKLGFFTADASPRLESRIPYDYSELIGAVAPRPVYVLSPTYNRDATAGDVKEAMDQAGKVFSLYNAKSKLVMDEPWDYFRLSLPAQDRIVKWMTENMK